MLFKLEPSFPRTIIPMYFCQCIPVFKVTPNALWIYSIFVLKGSVDMIPQIFVIASVNRLGAVPH